MENIHKRVERNSPRCGGAIPCIRGRGRRDVILKRWMALCLAAGALSASPKAFAVFFAGHFYGTIANPAVPPGYADVGAEVDLEPTALSVPSSCTDFVNHEFWYGLDHGGSLDAPTYWVELGIKDGETGALGCTGSYIAPGVFVQGPQVFWADNVAVHSCRGGTCGGYHEYYPAVTVPSYGTVYTAWVQQDFEFGGNCDWSANINGTKLGVSGFNCPGSGRFLMAGIEATSTGAGRIGQGWAGNLGHATSAGWFPKWADRVQDVYPIQGTSDSPNTPPPYCTWDNTWSKEWLNDPFPP